MTAAVCEGGHCGTAMLRAGSVPDKFCNRCGKAVLTKCPSCNSKIRGAPFGSVSAPGFRPPHSCPDCGKPFPWTLRDLERAKTAIKQHAEEHGISKEESDTLEVFANDVVSGTANEAQISGAQALLKKFGPAGTVLWGALTDIAAKTVAAMMKP